MRHLPLALVIGKGCRTSIHPFPLQGNNTLRQLQSQDLRSMEISAARAPTRVWGRGETQTHVFPPPFQKNLAKERLSHVPSKGSSSSVGPKAGRKAQAEGPSPS